MSNFTKNDITIYDNFLPLDQFQSLINYVNNINYWAIQKSSRRSKNQFLIHDVSDNEYFNVFIFRYIQNILKKEYKIERIYFNGQWPNRNGDIHVDGCEKTALIYVSEYYHNWGGFTQFVFDDNQELIISPVQNRLVLFPGMIMHKGYAFCNQECPMRISLAYKLY